MVRKKVLIVDDQMINRKILNKILSTDYDILQAEDGIQALEILRRENTEISAVILDLVMPRLDGYGVLKKMAEDAVLSSIPVVVASQESESIMEEKAFEYGAKDFIMKPYNAGVLKQRLKTIIELFESLQCINNIERDSLTGLYTKDAFYRKAVEVLAQHADTQYMIVATNIDRFKLINDSYGNLEGDRLLQYLSRNLMEGVHEQGGICGRSTADRFLALVPKFASKEEFERVVMESREMSSKYPLDMKISLKFGAYIIDDYELPIALMCDRAMLAAEKIKGQYDVFYAFYDDSVRQQMIREQQITNEMKNALATNQFQVYFQPKYDLISETIAGAEALVRWTHPELGFISPGEFIPLFEKNGCITELDQFVWDKTCAYIAQWIENDHKYVPVSVNVSRKDIYNENLPELLMDMIDAHWINTGTPASGDYRDSLYGRCRTVDSRSWKAKRSGIRN